MMRRYFLVLISSLFFVLILISNSAVAMTLTRTPTFLIGEIGGPFDIVVTMGHEAGDTGLMTSFQLRLEWDGSIIDVDTVSFTNQSSFGTYNGNVVNNANTYDVSWNFGAGIPTPDTILGTFHFLGNEVGSWDAEDRVLDIHSSGISYSGGTIVDNYGDSYYMPITITANSVPIPSTVFLLGIGLFGLAGVSRRKK